MTQPNTDASSVYLDCWNVYGGTVALLEDMISSRFLWDPPTELPTMYVQKPVSPVIAPHIDVQSCEQFLGHKFRLGGSKK